MYDKTQTIRNTRYIFPKHKFIEYEESDLIWALPCRYAKVDGIVEQVYKNDEKISTSIIPNVDQSENIQIFIKQEILRTSIVYNPFSTWKPKWNPTTIG